MYLRDQWYVAARSGEIARTPLQRWLLDEHRLRDGVPLLPGTGFIELARAGFESPPEDRVVEIRDALFLAPFPLPEGQSREIRVELRRSGTASSFTIASPADPGDPTAFVEHARGEIAYTDDHVPPVCDLEALRARCARVEEVTGLRFQDHLAFGPRWQVLRRWGEDTALRLGIDSDENIEKKLVLEGIILGNRTAFEASLAEYLIKLEKSPLFDQPAIDKKSLEFYQNSEVLRFTAQLKLS